MTQFVTRCPKCSTSFRITQAQLDRAKGAVRCGSCLQIFRANDHIVSQVAAKPAAKVAPAKSAPAAKATASTKPAAAAPKAATTAKPSAAKATSPAKKPAPAVAKTAADSKPANKTDGLKFNQKAIDEEAEWDDSQLIHDDLFEEQDKDRTGELSENFFDVYEPSRAKHQPERTLFDREIKGHEEEEEADNTDESWALSILEASEDESREEEKRKPAQEQYSRATTGTFSALTDEDIEDALGDTFRTTGQQPKFDPEPEPEPEPSKSKNSARTLFTLEEDESRPKPMFTEMEEIDDDPAIRSYDPEKRAIIRSIEPEPLEFGFHIEGSPWPKRLLWGGLSVLALYGFIWQIAHYNLDDWGRHASTRPYYQNICPLLGCTLPPLSEPGKVMASNLVVRSHPRMNDALLIDAVLLNKASFEQPFPPLVIQFSDLQGNLVASRRFVAREYLAGEMAGQTIMPSNQPVHIALEILDPGKDAVNYSAHIAQ
ncbi:DUF3426 domain-containing protein [Simiduia litorea]|uniref:zinc-ribbon and DUF3426 domain-containing protein n=1 Tax=Simiduia litorea TaxID=1435348 RepID=UPI0036F20BE3